MRIRSIRPEFWSSEDVAAMPWETRLVYIGLWSYVDDNGVGRDSERLITAALFPLEEDFRESSRRVTGALRHLSSHGQITRYAVDAKPYLHVSAWNTHQRIEKASKARYPLPTCENAELRIDSGSTPGALPEMSSIGEGEKGRRGEGDKPSSASADAEREFDEFWKLYPRRKDKGHAFAAFKKARRKVGAEVILDGLRRQLPEMTSKEEQFRAYPATWLNGERWADEVDEQTNVRVLTNVRDLELPPDGLSPAEYAEWDRKQRAKQAKA